jgi:T5SS/PEP-CTERM-associated repeat protein
VRKARGAAPPRGGIVGEDLFVANSTATSDGTISITGPGTFLRVLGALVVGKEGKGAVTVDGATLEARQNNTAQKTTIGATPDAQASVILKGSDFILGYPPDNRRADLVVGTVGQNVNAHSLAVDANSQVKNVQTLTVNPTGTVSGSSRIDATQTKTKAGAKVSMGEDGGIGRIATLTLDGDLDASEGMTLLVELDGTFGVTYDVLEVTGIATLGGEVNVTDLGVPFVEGQVFDIVQADGGLTGEFANLPPGIYEGGAVLPALPAGLYWQVSYGDHLDPRYEVRLSIVAGGGAGPSGALQSASTGGDGGLLELQDSAGSTIGNSPPVRPKRR